MKLPRFEIVSVVELIVDNNTDADADNPGAAVVLLLGPKLGQNVEKIRRPVFTVGGRFNLAQIELQDQTGLNDLLNSSSQFQRFNPVIGATYKLAPGLTLYGGYSEANRAPTPLELGCSDPNHPCMIDSFLVDFLSPEDGQTPASG